MLPYTIREVIITGAQGVKLPANVWIPKGQGPFPGIIFIHSWALNQFEYIAQMEKFARAGYVVLAYDCRGWGLAGGRIETAGPLEMQDLNRVVDWLIANTPVDPSRIGATGISYGGGQSLLALAFEPRVKTIVAMSGWTDLAESLAPNDSVKWLWATLLVGSAALLGRESTDLLRWFLSAFDYQKFEQTKEDFRLRSAATYINQINASGKSAFIINGINDDLFTSRQIVNFYQALTIPKKLYLANGIHATAEAPGLLFLPSHVWSQAMDWFDYWLKGEENGIMKEKPVAIYQNWDLQVGRYDDWPIPGTEEKAYYLV
ncbi:MAG: alpha/beta fold hydrolase [Clostridia bacterium]|nr:alpha/beta fold hydrolase [Clostridia bacterium]